ncbi:MAG: polymer-forming cytoskeletal protein [Rickettsiales bacterium]
MFRRKEDLLNPEEYDAAIDTGEKSMSTATAPAQPAAANTNAAPAASTPATAPSPSAPVGRAPMAPATPAFRPQGAGMAKPGENRASAPSAIASGKGSKRILTVGNDITLNGEIASCDRIVIEGRVDAILKEVHTVEIAESGSFKGKAEIEDAEISGVFDGELVVRNRLTIYSTGKVRGKIAYGEIEIERGGEITGEIVHGAAASGAKKSAAA